MSVTPPRSRWRKAVLLSCAPGLAIAAVLVSLRCSSSRGSALALQARCHNNLRALGQSMMLYANERSDGHFPSSFGRLLATQDLTTTVFVCPASDDTPARGGSIEAREADLTSGRHLSYVYTGQALNWKCDASCILAYELPGHHSGGTHVLFGDGHVDFVPDSQVAEIAAELKAGFNPPRREKINNGKGISPVELPEELKAIQK